MEQPTTPWDRLGAFLRRDAALGYVLVLPMVVFTISMLIYPFTSALVLSFEEKPAGQPAQWVGLQNYIELLSSDKVFPAMVRNTLIYTVATVMCKLGLGMAMALTLNQDFKFRGIVRGILLIPFVTPDLVVATTWRFMFDATFGVINYVLKTLGIISSNIAWMTQVPTALGAVVVANVWRGFPFFGITLLAGLQSISSERYEAAQVDGANVFQRFRHITLPGLRAVILVATILSTIWTFNDFTLVYMMTGGAPADQTHIFATYTYMVTFKYNRIGYGMSITAIMIPILVVLIMALAPRMFREE